MTQAISRRAFTAGSVATLVGGGTVQSTPLVRAGAAQGSTDLASLGLPALDITVTAEGYEGAPETLEPGRYLLTVTLAEGVEESGVSFLQPPAGMSMEAFLEETGLGGAAPEASPAVEDDGDEVLPTPVYQAVFAGGVHIVQGVGSQAVIDLGPGEWIMGTDDREATQRPLFYTIAGEMPTVLPEPAADIDVTLIDFAITVEGALTAGEHVMRIANQGAQPHYLELLKGPNVMADEHIRQVLEAEMGGEASPAPPPFDPETDLSFALFTETQSIGVVTWFPVTLEAANYAALCFFPAAGTGVEHAYMGMHTVFTVT